MSSGNFNDFRFDAEHLFSHVIFDLMILTTVTGDAMSSHIGPLCMKDLHKHGELGSTLTPIDLPRSASAVAAAVEHCLACALAS